MYVDMDEHGAVKPGEWNYVCQYVPSTVQRRLVGTCMITRAVKQSVDQI